MSSQGYAGNEPLKPARPYTDYNIFFQLERDYVLQVLFGVKPSLDADSVFNPNCEEYPGPPLPTRYSKLVLPDDWYIPGKGRRRKRRHRKSHGKIGVRIIPRTIHSCFYQKKFKQGSYSFNLFFHPSFMSSLGKLPRPGQTQTKKFERFALSCLT